MKKEKIMKAIISCVLAVAVVFAFIPSSEGQKRPYGVTEGNYGQKRPVKTKGEARKILRDFFRGRDVNIGEIRERELFFEAEIRDENGRVIDRVIIDKRTGRARSTF